MRLSNRNKAGYFQFLSTLVTVGLFLGIFLFFLERYRYHYLGWSEFLLIIIPILGILIFYLRGRQIFEYDSDGEALNFKNRNVVLFLDKALSDEFPKYKLKNYEVLNAIILKKLYITISSKKNHSIILKYDISYLTKKELNDLKMSLSKVIKTNKERENN
ncbi:hypothetical protein EG338_09775 [Kaistella haifensis]|nr:hypothetical protein EG338_09775 [Kaistella haifensis]MDN5577716.1 hypothetical protein [Chryseobacterium sp.]